ncbi:hypothetical protein [Bradyrhizobium sp. Ec3.3]|uniref:hypothetical protein n=1 Tax=Bradyrhizobium sp. Ec3.3 TaxID=189753 RepID=UPI0012EB67F4|nr:hypothetical protein [Bradyrhizobium sp. Ec3.3]
MPSEAQRWLAIADSEDRLEDALIYFGRASATDPGRHPPAFWFDIYKALECLIDRFGGAAAAKARGIGGKRRLKQSAAEAEFIKLDWAPPNDVERLKRTANWARHARRKFDQPSPATTEQEAKDLMIRLLRKAFETAGTP